MVVIHGGFWKAEYDASLGEPLAAELTAAGWTTLNVEYRRVGDGGGFPATLDDVHAALEALAGTDVDTATVVTLGHSAGGTSRPGRPPGGGSTAGRRRCR